MPAVHLHFWMLPIFILIGATAWRIRGTGRVSDIVARFVVWGIPVGLLTGWALHSEYPILPAVALAGLGCSFGYWGNFDLTQPANKTLTNYAKLGAFGMLRFTPMFIAALALDYGFHLYHPVEWYILPAVFAGLFMAPAYFLGIKIIPHLSLPLLRLFTEWGEFLFGGFIFGVYAAGLIAW